MNNVSDSEPHEICLTDPAPVFRMRIRTYIDGVFNKKIICICFYQAKIKSSFQKVLLQCLITTINMHKANADPQQ